MNLKDILFFILINLTFQGWILCQSCNLPILSTFSDASINSFKIEWLDFNSDVLSYEIELGEKGFSRSFEANIAGITENEYLFNSLNSGTAYELYIRTVCNEGDTSLWNGPYFYNTIIENNNFCQLLFDIEDNNCPSGQEFLIDVSGFDSQLLGIDVVLEKVELIVSHPWPPDLLIKLVSPYNSEIILSKYNGNGNDDFGNSKDTSCQEFAIFSDNACESIEEVNPPFVGNFRPEEQLSTLFNGQSPDGIWKLFVCDRAANDLGKLLNVHLNFSEEACVIPRSFNMIDIESDNATINWSTSSRCENLKILYKRIIDPISETFTDFAECEDGEFQILDLIPNTEYELTVVSQCDEESNSPPSCIIYFQTSCQNSSSFESFDSQAICQAVCDAACELNGIWKNADSNDSDWIINQGRTLTAFTGPTGDKNQIGKYIYIENQLDLCSESQRIDLISDCVNNLNTSDCSVSFYYHMYGEDVGVIQLDYSKDAVNWKSIWSQIGNQGDQWNFVSVPLEDNFQHGNLRFRVFKTRDALRGDIALDHIKLIGIDAVDLNVFYQDEDNDGFGNASSTIAICSDIAPLGYTDNELDCDDNNPLINPIAQEISCNNIDENCNGIDDDISIDDINYQIIELLDENCLGSEDGIIELSAVQGMPPYEYIWNTGQIGARIEGLSAGVYYCSISDINSCETVTDPIVVKSTEQLIYSAIAVVPPSCDGKDDGLIGLTVSGGQGNYEVLWNNGMNGLTIDTLSEGNYQATISDGSGCELITDNIALLATPVVTAGISLKRDIDCFGDSNGFLQLGVLGGIPPYSINWSTGDSIFLITDLEAGEYSVTVTDNEGCRDIVSGITIDQPDSLTIRVNNIEHVSCNDGFDSFIDIRIQGGTSPYSYFWSDGSFTEDIFNKKAGVYSVTVTDFNACSAQLTELEILEPSPILVTQDSIRAVNCIGSNNGFISVIVEGGTTPYEYNWNINAGSASTQSELDSLFPGSYFLTVVDNFGCKSESFSFELENRNKEINISLNQIDEILCFGDNTGSIQAVANEGILPLDFNWSNGVKRVKSVTIDTIDQLLSDGYNLTVTDNEGCVGISDSIEIISPDELIYVVSSIENNGCWDSEEGGIDILVSGGVEPYRYNWSNGITASTSIDNLVNDNYWVTISDSNDCKLISQEINVSSPEELLINLNITNPSNQQEGVIEIIAEGGNPPYNYNWAFPIENFTDSIASNLMEGEYSLTVTDANSCSKDTVVVLDFINSIELLNLNEQIIVFPNPVSDHLVIEYPENEIRKLELVSSNGSMVMENDIKANSTKTILDISTFSQGAYILCLNTSYGIICKKLLIFN